MIGCVSYTFEFLILLVPSTKLLALWGGHVVVRVVHQGGDHTLKGGKGHQDHLLPLYVLATGAKGRPLGPAAAGKCDTSPATGDTLWPECSDSFPWVAPWEPSWLWRGSTVRTANPPALTHYRSTTTQESATRFNFVSELKEHFQPWHFNHPVNSFNS